jgi:hypothetical protein
VVDTDIHTQEESKELRSVQNAILVGVLDSKKSHEIGQEVLVLLKLKLLYASEQVCKIDMRFLSHC